MSIFRLNTAQEEENLSKAAGMNRFISAIILNHVTLDDFIAMTGKERQQIFSPYVGCDAIVRDIRREINPSLFFCRRLSMHI